MQLSHWQTVPNLGTFRRVCDFCRVPLQGVAYRDKHGKEFCCSGCKEDFAAAQQLGVEVALCCSRCGGEVKEFAFPNGGRVGYCTADCRTLGRREGMEVPLQGRPGLTRKLCDFCGTPITFLWKNKETNEEFCTEDCYTLAAENPGKRYQPQKEKGNTMANTNSKKAAKAAGEGVASRSGKTRSKGTVIGGSKSKAGSERETHPPKAAEATVKGKGRPSRGGAAKPESKKKGGAGGRQKLVRVPAAEGGKDLYKWVHIYTGKDAPDGASVMLVEKEGGRWVPVEKNIAVNKAKALGAELVKEYGIPVKGPREN